MKYHYRGMMAPVLTPFTNNSAQDLNLSIIPKYAKFLKDTGIKGVLVNGTSGEGMSLTVSERKAVTAAWAEAVKSTKQNLMVQIGGACLKDVQEMAAHAEKLGVDGLLCLPELFNSPSTVDELVNYLSYVAEAAPKTPLLYYHNPPYTGVRVSIPKFLTAASKKIPTFSGAKYTDTNLEEGSHCILVEDTSVFLGCDHVLAGAFTLGFDSAIATTLNMFPSYSLNILEAVEKGDTVKAKAEQRKLTAAIFAVTRNGGWVATMKAVMNLLTPINVGEPRPPLVPLTPSQIQEMKEELKGLKLL
uniref:N-acetylneuraminate lyase n=1 Tax=Timema bartmani TaxID=61472 RepID=A0A7R9EXK2_9NEOP|nr:unnamed protein product [Timema bartmani]